MSPRLSRAEFEEVVGDALDRVPAELLDAMENVVILVQDECPPGDELLGLYTGVPLTERSPQWVVGEPDRIEIFQGPLERLCRTREELEHEIAVTVVHELAHHFGIDDARLHELGWG